ncbi:hypothetical protein [Ruminococcus sp. 5_1_39BFAA]|uniref:hypothetical protein n=1 Tax=Ruminococcus sp. 5_1_39BFAA TaxID=457412 RepID=UPI003561B357
MIMLTEEQKALLNCYQGGRYKVIRQLKEGIEILKEEHEDVEMIEDMEAVVAFLRGCSNRMFFQMKKSVVLDTETEGEEIDMERTDG